MSKIIYQETLHVRMDFEVSGEINQSTIQILKVSDYLY